MIVGGGVEELRSVMGEVLEAWIDEVIPAEVELLPNHGYSARYAWMFAYEKRLKYRIEDCLGRPLKDVERVLFGTDGVVSEVLSNAFVHGHRRNPELMIRVSCSVSRKALLFTIVDQGGGFDSDAVAAKLNRGVGYFHQAGNGMRALAEKPGITASFETGGRTTNLRVDLT
jgi:hypothetical protein